MALSSGKRMLIASVVFLAAIAFAVLIFVANRTDYRPLFTNLSAEDAGEIVKKLKDAKTPYQITPDGKGVMVPSDKVYELRMSLASEGLPQGGGVGFEIFDRKNFGMTEFVQKLNYQRALQGELSRTISQIAGVEQARVHLVIPEKSLFKESEKPATASIVLKMKSSRALRDSEVQGVVHLVSASIEGMDPEHVTILDSRGKILSKGGSSDPTARMTSAMQETQRGYEKSVEERLQSLLDRIVVYPVEDEHHYCDGKGRVLPDAFLMKKGSTPHDLAYQVHTDIGKGFLYAVDARSKMRIKENHVLKNGDIIKIVSAAK